MTDITTFDALKAYWASDEGKPYKGQLIDIDAYEPGNLSCMCAQGQILHVLGGVDPASLAGKTPEWSDAETAKLLNISVAHAALIRQINDSREGAPIAVFDDLGSILGDQWSKLLDFWWFLDHMRAAAWAAAGDAAWAAAGDAAGDAAWAAAGDAAGDAAWEIQGAALMKESGQALFFLPLFGFTSVDDIPARPANYGIMGMAA